MIAVERAAMTEELRAKLDEKVVGPGQRWLDAHREDAVAKRPPDFWREVMSDLASAFHRRCAYTAMWINCDGSVDHFVSIDEDRARAYDWENFRYCAGWFNSKKQHARASALIDPLAVADGWFELSWPDLQLGVTELCPLELRAKAAYMLDALELRNGDKVIKNRRAYRDLFERHGPSALPILDEQAPLVARAIRKHGLAAVTAGGR